MKTHRKPYRIKRKKSILGNRFLWLTILILIIIGGLFYFGVFSSTFQIKEIKISGNQKVSTENLKNIIEEKLERKLLFLEVPWGKDRGWLFVSRSIFLVDFTRINQILLEKFPQIAKITLKRKFPDVLMVETEERRPVAIFAQAENYYFIDKEGVIFEKISETNFFLPKIQNFTLKKKLDLGEKATEKELLSQILEINSELKENLKIDIEEFVILTEERLNVKTSEGWEIYFNSRGDINWQLTKLSLVLKERIPPEKRRNLEHIDLRFEKVYIFPETYGF